ncbi:putative nuclease HARBI1 [Formica fusca]
MRVFRLSRFQNMCTQINFPENSHLLGDSAYVIQKYIMVPFRDNGHLSETEINYNKIHSSARMIVERSLGLLKGRFRNILDNLPMTRADLIPKYIVACCIMHNICLLHDDMIDIPIIVNVPQCQSNHDDIDIQSKEEGIQKRNCIAQALMNPQLFS